jgi:WD40 repeat protein
MRIWDLRSGKRTFILKGHQHLIHSFRFDEDLLVSASKDTTLKIWVGHDISLDLTFSGSTNELPVPINPGWAQDVSESS